MKNENKLQLNKLGGLDLEAVLIPTEDASVLCIISNEMYSFDNSRNKRNGDGIKNHHLYLCSTREIKEGDWFIIQIENNFEVHKAIGFTETRIKFKSNNQEFTSFKEESKKVEFTSNPKLIADGVPALPEKALFYYKEKIAGRGDYKAVNFLSYFCEQYNQKQSANVKGVDVNAKEILLEVVANNNNSFDIDRDVKTTEDVLKAMEEYKNQSANVKGVDVEKLAEEKYPNEVFVDINIVKSLRKAFIKGYNQALQSNAGGFSLEDINKAIDMARPVTPLTKDFKKITNNEIIQSLTPKPKGEIQMWCEMEGCTGICNKIAHDHSDNAEVCLGGCEEKTIKLNKEGQPIIHFNK